MQFVLAAYYIVLFAWAATAVFGLFIGFGADIWDAILTALLAVLAVVIIGIALFRPTARKFVILGAALALGAGLVWSELPSRASIPLFFAVRGRAMDRFVDEIRRDGRIRAMSNGDRHFKELNGHLVGYTPAEVDPLTPAMRRREPLDSVLESERIPRDVYERYRRTLRELGLLSFEQTDSYVAFVSDGLLDNLYGFVYVLPGHSPPALGTEFVEATQLVALKPLPRGWYFFTTT